MCVDQVDVIGDYVSSTYVLRSQWWLRQRRKWLVKSMRRSLLMPSRTSLPMSASAAPHSTQGFGHPHDPCWPAVERGTQVNPGGQRGQRLECWHPGRKDWQHWGCQQLLNTAFVCASPKEVCGKLKVYFGACACLCAINNGWGQWWECGGGNRRCTPANLVKTKH